MKTNPLFTSCVEAGFPSPADDYIENNLDLNEYLVKHPSATFFVRVQGNSMQNAGIFSGDILIVDRSVSPAHRKIIVAILNGEFTVKRMLIEGKKIILSPENPSYPSIEVNPESEFQVWGVVTYVIHSAK